MKGVNDDDYAHTATHHGKPAFTTSMLSKGESGTISFQEVTGEDGLEYYCGPHQRMKGRIVVRLAGSHLAWIGHGGKHKTAAR